MARCCFSFTRLLLLSLLLMILFSNGFGRKILDASVHEEHAVTGASEQGKSRVVIELDYTDPGPNFNERSGVPFTNPSITPLPPPSPPPPPPFGH